jgi:hypothetical protein
MISSLLSGAVANPKASFAALVVFAAGFVGDVWAGSAAADRTPTAIAQGASAPKSDPLFMTQAQFEKLDCKSRWRLYRRSQECFAPFIQQPPYVAPPDAYAKCGTGFQDPSLQCKIEPLP